MENDFRNDLLKNGVFDILNQKKINFFQKIVNSILSFFAIIFQFVFFIIDESIVIFQKMNFRNRILILTLIAIFLATPLYFFYRKDNSIVSQPVSNQNSLTPNPTPTPQPPRER